MISMYDRREREKGGDPGHNEVLAVVMVVLERTKDNA
jgi:hypothetical protein